MKKWLNDYLRFTLKERIGVFILLAILIAFLWLPKLYPSKLDLVIPDTALAKLFQMPVSSDSLAIAVAETTAITHPIYFYFDPNTIGEQDWKNLGLRIKTIRTILHYRNKGGTFKLPEDLRKIWGLPTATADALIPYIRIHQNKATNYQGFTTSKFSAPIPSTKKEPLLIDINTATAIDWEKLPGIGPVLAARIVKYRDKIGGFTTILQVQQTYGIKDSLFQILQPMLLLTLKQHVLTRPSINTATAKAMKQAGLKEEIADAIVNYRKQYGLFNELKDLKRIAFVNDSIYSEIIRMLQL